MENSEDRKQIEIYLLGTQTEDRNFTIFAEFLYFSNS